MESSTRYIPKKEYVPGAHPVSESILGKVAKLQTAKDRATRVNMLSQIYLGLHQFLDQNQITQSQVNKKKAEKAKRKGRLDSGIIRVRYGQKKLVRDLISTFPQTENNIGATFYKADRHEHLRELDIKLSEEVSELLEAKTKEEQIEELADVSENLDAILKFRNIDRREINIRIYSTLNSGKNKKKNFTSLNIA